MRRTKPGVWSSAGRTFALHQAQEDLPLCPVSVRPGQDPRAGRGRREARVPHCHPLRLGFEPGCPGMLLGCLLSYLGLSFLLPKMGLRQGCVQVNLVIGRKKSCGGCRALCKRKWHVVERVAMWGPTPARDSPSLASLLWGRALCYPFMEPVGE